jgi:DNA-binding response OmpR family regulator
VSERAEGLDADADDYLSKPFVFAELSARIRAILRRGKQSGRAVLRIEDLELNRLAHVARRASHDIPLVQKNSHC